MSIIATVATIRRRQDQLHRVLMDIWPQVDEVYVYLNDYAQGDWNPPMAYPNVHPQFSGDEPPDPEGNLGDAGKFFPHDLHDNCYYITIDDDLLYPKDFVETLVAGIEKYQRSVAVTFHGRVLNPFMSEYTSYYRGVGEQIASGRVLGSVPVDFPVHFPGTGAFAYHTDTIRFDITDFTRYWPEGRNMADIWAGIKLKKKRVPCICLAHEEKWITHQPINYQDTIFEQTKNKDADQTRAINEARPWGFPTF